MDRDALQQAFIGIILGGYVIIAAAFAGFTPDWQTPDEPAHYNYIAQVVADGAFPVIEPGDWDQQYLEALKAARFEPELLDDLESIEYEDHQPPLYYVLLAPIYVMTDGSLTTLRLFSALIGLAIPLCAYHIGLLMFPERPWVGLGAAAFVAFLPQHVHILASVNNDSLAWAIIAVTLLATIAYLKDQPVKPWQLGLLVGLGFLTKTTTYFMAGVVMVALLLRWWMAHQSVRNEANLTFPEEARNNVVTVARNHLLRNVLVFLIPALALGSIWWVRNIELYGSPDFLGLAAHDAVVVGQPRTAPLIDRLGVFGYLREIVMVTFRSFWGQFGWMGVPLQPRFYYAIFAAVSFALGGWIVDWRRRKDTTTPPEQRAAWVALALTVVLAALAFIYYNTEFQQHQGRYLFPMLIPLGIALALGLDGWRRWLMDIVEARSIEHYDVWDYVPWGVVVAFLTLVPFDVWLLWRIIVPNLRP